MRDSWRRIITRETTRLHRDGRGALLWSLRVTIASVASYVAALSIFSGPPPLLAPLTAMLVVQVTPLSLLASGLDRVVSVVAGVTLAVLFAELVPLAWWSLGVLIFLSITIGQVLRLRANLMEVAISAMLVLGVGSFAAGSAAWQRIAETLIGAAVGIAANLLFPPKVAAASAGRAIDDVADSMSELLSRAADELEALVADGTDLRAAVRGWLGDARRINHDIPRAGAALLHAEQGRRLNVRAVGTPNKGPGLRQGLEALEHSSVAVRVMFRTFADAMDDPAWPTVHDADGLLGLALTWREMAAAVDAFGQLVADEASEPGRRDDVELETVREALEGLHEARARLEESWTIRSPGLQLDLDIAVLTTVKRLLSELDLDQRLRRQLRLARTVPRRVSRPPSRRRQRRFVGPTSEEPTVQERDSSSGVEGRAPEVSPEAETQLIDRVADDLP